jgi:ATP-dependent helicase Lhr and Lhr-like helicase
VALYFRDDARWLGPPPTKSEPPSSPLHDAIRERLAAGAAFWTDLLADLGEVEPVRLQEALWDLAWAGEVTNDAFAPLRAPRLTLARSEREAGRRFARRRRPGAPQVLGRWSLTAALFADAPAQGPRMRALSELMLERYGIVTRETALAEGVPGGFSTLYGELTNLETLGTARRGYFVEGLGGAQFALPAAIERLRTVRSDEPAGALVLAVTDPANPYGATLPWPKREDDDSGRRPSRVPGAYVVTLNAEPVLYVERGGKALVALREPDGDWLRPALEALADAVRRGRMPRLGLERFDGEPVVGSEVGSLLVELGFRRGPRRLTLSA